ncbi:MAG: hypothetical protein HYU63_03125, partial [Armatimonadetes bacterium]|nr:hypothetical protein [Armatimonadota bacterium]
MPNKKSPLTFIILQGPPAENNEITLFFQEAREAIVRDTLNKVSFIPEIKEKILISGSQKLLKDFKEIKTKFLPYKKHFHLGNYLLELIQEYNLNKLIYFGGGAAPLISKEELSKLAGILIKEKNIVVANNFFSCDFLGFTPASTLNLIEDLPACDNPLSFLLAEKGGLRYKRLPVSAGTFFDIDTPIDLAILKLYPENGYFTKKILESYPFPTDKLKKIQSIFKNNKNEILIFGRISSAVYSYLFGKLLCRLRV